MKKTGLNENTFLPWEKLTFLRVEEKMLRLWISHFCSFWGKIIANNDYLSNFEKFMLLTSQQNYSDAFIVKNLILSKQFQVYKSI